LGIAPLLRPGPAGRESDGGDLLDGVDEVLGEGALENVIGDERDLQVTGEDGEARRKCPGLMPGLEEGFQTQTEDLAAGCLEHRGQSTQPAEEAQRAGSGVDDVGSEEGGRVGTRKEGRIECGRLPRKTGPVGDSL